MAGPGFAEIRMIDLSHIPDECGVYRIRNKWTGESYIGGPGSLSRRLGNHLLALRAGSHEVLAMQQSFNEHGEVAFEFEVLATCDVDDIPDRERAYIMGQNPSWNTFRQCHAKRLPSSLRYQVRTPSKRRGMSHEQRAHRRGLIAQEIGTGVLDTEIAKKYDVSPEYVRIIRTSVVGIRHKRGRRAGGHNDAIAKVPSDKWAKVDWNKPDHEIASELGVTRQRVNEARKQYESFAPASR
jgi:group I intron endonuclease